MDKLRAMQLFVRLADVGSFTQLAEQMACSKSMISKEIRRLEEHLGVRLLHRSTRNIQVTHAGEAYLVRAKEILNKIDDADHWVQELQQQPQGKLKINAPMALGILELAAMFADFMQAYPDIELDIHLGDEDVDLVEQGFDLGFRASSRPFDSNYIGRPLTEFQYRICASPQYLAQHPHVRTPDDLQQHHCFIYSYFKGKNIWPVGSGIRVKGKLRVNSTIFIMEAIKKELGIGFIPDFVCNTDIRAGKVVEILADTPKPTLTLYALYPARQFAPAKLMHCIQFMEEWFQQAPQK